MNEYFGKYILLEKLASGGMAEVYLARAPGAGGISKFVAVKKILPQFSDNKEFVDMFKDEAKITINLSHSNIVGIYEFGVENGQFYLVMDYVEGKNIRQILNKMKPSKQNFSVDQVVFMVKEIAAGLDHAHRCLDGATGKPLNITHRDMSPQNVMVSFEGEVKIIDFGIAKAESKLETTRAGTLKGKFGYMSPEQAEGHEVDLRTDIFSLGTVLWELLANDRLFIANNEINTLKKIRDCQIPSLTQINPSVHPDLEKIVFKALTKDKNNRYQTAADFYKELNRFLNRHFPDFSSHDFSMFIKSIYTDEILDIRKKHVEYSKIPFKDEMNKSAPSSDIDEDKTVVIASADSTPDIPFESDPEKTNAETNDFLDSNLIMQQMETSPGQNIPSLEEQQTQTNSQIAQQNVNSNTQTKTEIPTTDYHDEPNTQTATRIDPSEHGQIISGSDTLNSSGQPDTNSSVKPPDFTNIQESTNSQVNANLSLNTNSQIIKPASLNTSHETSPITMAIAGLIFTVVGYLAASWAAPDIMRPFNKMVSGVLEPIGFYKLMDSSGVNTAIKDLGIPEFVPFGRKALTSKAETQPQNVKKPENNNIIVRTKALIIGSKPSNAEIYVNGKSTAKFTPSRVEFNLGDRPLIIVKKDGYRDYSFKQTKVNELPNHINAELQAAPIAYITIDVRPNKFAEIYIDNKKILLKGGRLPAKNVKVFAEKNIEVKAFNPVTKSTTVKNINLKEGERRDITLFLKRSPASSSKKNK